MRRESSTGAIFSRTDARAGQRGPDLLQERSGGAKYAVDNFFRVSETAGAESFVRRE